MESILKLNQKEFYPVGFWMGSKSTIIFNNKLIKIYLSLNLTGTRKLGFEMSNLDYNKSIFVKNAI